MKNIYWTENAEPKGTTLARVIYGLRSEAKRTATCCSMP